VAGDVGLGTGGEEAGREAATVAVFTDLAATANPHRVDAYEELAKYFEHRERNHAMALEMTRCAMKYCDTPGLRKREERLSRRLPCRRLGGCCSSALEGSHSELDLRTLPGRVELTLYGFHPWLVLSLQGLEQSKQ